MAAVHRDAGAVTNDPMEASWIASGCGRKAAARQHDVDPCASLAGAACGALRFDVPSTPKPASATTAVIPMTSTISSGRCGEPDAIAPEPWTSGAETGAGASAG